MWVDCESEKTIGTDGCEVDRIESVKCEREGGRKHSFFVCENNLKIMQESACSEYFLFVYWAHGHERVAVTPSKVLIQSFLMLNRWFDIIRCSYIYW